MGRSALTPRPTTYAGVRMRSRLEASYAQDLDRRGIKWEYEPQCFAGPIGQWLPDFSLAIPGQPVYVEVKPAGMYGDAADGDPWAALSKVMLQMEVVWASDPKAMLLLVLWEYPSFSDAEFTGWSGDGWHLSAGVNGLTVPVTPEGR